MKKRTLGNTGLLVTPLGLGLAALGRPGYINLGHGADLNLDYDVQAMEKHAHDVLDAAWAVGIRYFDAARSYGRAEHFLSSWLKKRGVSPQEVTIGSKWGYTYTAGWKVAAEKHEVKDHSLPVLMRQIQESRDLLGSYLDLYQIHSATLDSGVLDNQSVLGELAAQKSRGLLIGLSLSGSAQTATLRRALEIRFDGLLLFNSVQATWNLLSQEAGEALQEAHDAGLGIIVKEALANGRLTDRNNDPAFASKKKALSLFAEKNNTSIDAVALAFVLAQPWADVVLSGAARVDHLTSNVAALDLEASDLQNDLLDQLCEPAAEYWAKRSQLEWN